MAIIIDTLKEELERLLRMKQTYTEKLNSLPKGSIVFKTINDKKYPYLIYRKGLKIITVYIKQEELENIKKKIMQRNALKKDLQEINKDVCVIKKVVKE